MRLQQGKPQGSGAFLIFGFNTDVKYADTVYHVQSEARHQEFLLQTLVFLKGQCVGKRVTSYAEKMQDPAFSEELIHELLKEQHKRFVDAVGEGRIAAETEPPDTGEARPTAPTPALSLSDLQELAVVAQVDPESLPVESFVVPVVATEVSREPALSEPQPIEAAHEPVVAVYEEPAAQRSFELTPAGSQIGRGLALECARPTAGSGGSSITIAVKVFDEGTPAGEAQVACRVTSGSAAAKYVYANASTDGIADVQLALEGLDLTATALLIQANHRGKSASRKYKLHLST